MPSAPFQPIRSRYVVIARDDIDTDQIIPARFLKTTTRSGLGTHAFADWRYDAAGTPRADFPLNDPAKREARVLVAGNNFGCGSSREHAVWALMAAGFTAVISTQFADIFRGNALGNGLLPVTVSPDVLRVLSEADGAGSDGIVTVDLDTQTLGLPDGHRVQFPVPAFAKQCLLRGMDELDILLESWTEIESWERGHPGTFDTRLETMR